MTTTVYTAESSGPAIDMTLASGLSSSAVGATALDGVLISLHKAQQQVNNLSANIMGEGLAKNDTVLRTIVSGAITSSASSSSEATFRAVGLTGDSTDLTFSLMPGAQSGVTQTWPVIGAYAYPVLAGFQAGFGSEKTFLSFQFSTGLVSPTVTNGGVSWKPTIQMATSSSSSVSGKATFLVIGLPSGSSVPQPQLVNWSPKNSYATTTFSNLGASVSSAAVFIDSFTLTYGSAAQQVMDFGFLTANETVQLSCVESSTMAGKYDATVTWVPEMVLRDKSGHYLDVGSCSMAFRVFVFP